MAYQIQQEDLGRKNNLLVDYRFINNLIDTSNYVDSKQYEYSHKRAEAFDNRFQSCNEVITI